MSPERGARPGGLTVSVVVPTKHRAPLLACAVRRLLGQTAPIDELIVVDQSDTDEGRRLVEDALAAAPADRRPHLLYVRDPAVNGAAAARNVGFDLAAMDIVVCMDDDMAPEPDALERLLGHYARDAGVTAMTPVITNYALPPLAHRLVTAVFCRGPLRDDRQPVYWHWRRYGGRLVDVGVLGGGMLAVRRAALGPTRFDPRYRAASLGEDIDLSWSLARRGARLAIATDARVAHERPPRPDTRYEETLITSWGFVFDKHQPKTLRNRLAFAWFATGVALGALWASARRRSLAPIASVRAGLACRRRGYAGARFLAPR
ncbi:MAG: glycosyltransferase family 2 protein [Candidatus Rokuibacteriota bacterium]